jgi:hypothetical protein
MLDLILPDTAKVIRDVFKKDTGEDCELVLEKLDPDYSVYVNKATSARYLVQVSKTYDLFGFQNYCEDFPRVDAYIYIGFRVMIIQFADKLVKDWEEYDTWIPSSKKEKEWLASSFLLFDRIGGIVYDWQTKELVDKKLED